MKKTKVEYGSGVCHLYGLERRGRWRRTSVIWTLDCRGRTLDLILYLLICLHHSCAVLALGITKNAVCRPDAFTFCELPIITSLSEEPYPAFPGEKFELSCQGYGSPMPHIAWYKVLTDGESVLVPTSQGHHLVNQGGTLKVKHVVPHDDGKYICLATNNVGQAKFLVDIKVR